MMKYIQVAVLASMIAAFVHAISFSELTGDLTPNEENRIIGGSNADIDKYRFMASVLINGTKSESICGGTLVAPQYVLTAGQCLIPGMSDVYVSIGSKHRSGKKSKTSEMIHVVEAFRHPSYNAALDVNVHTYDVALLKLETPSKIHPARLAAPDGSDNKPGVVATTIGWGEADNEASSDILRAAKVKLITKAKCVKIYAAAVGGDITEMDAEIGGESIICADTGNGKGSCGNESGGPLLVNGVVVGITSSVSSKCDVDPGMFADVASASDFINGALSGGSSGNVTGLLAPWDGDTNDLLDKMVASGLFPV